MRLIFKLSLPSCSGIMVGDGNLAANGEDEHKTKGRDAEELRPVQNMYGEYFNGRECAEECVSTVGYIQPDCDIADTIVKYLRRKP
ncbi:hypothetical protein HPB51_015350 [Rhipicephalus microplus]|uniref:Uncharacterized protein n=1 Tax=Rhipicephalus microplus TaxID=6941 RepID=A0A9J6DVS0_RHIMP|nr:hypothetical protein HPB51_015350 [Rhipicephalus microplus]